MTRYRYPQRAGVFACVRMLFSVWVFAGLLVLSGCIIADIDGDSDRTDVVARASFSHTVDATDQARIRLEAVNGNVEIHGQPGATSVMVSGERQVGSHSHADAERRLDDLRVAVDNLGDEIVIRTIQPSDNQGRNYVVHYTITLPVDLDVLADLINGNLSIHTIDGFASVNTVNGNIRLRNIAGSATVVLTNGNIDSEVFLPSDGTVDLTTTNGNIILEIPHATSAALNARVTNGAINLSNLTLQDAESTSSSLAGTLGEGAGSIELRTVNGNIEVNGF